MSHLFFLEPIAEERDLLAWTVRHLQRIQEAFNALEEDIAAIDTSPGPGGPVAWDDITGKPATFPPSFHTHELAEISGIYPALERATTVPDLIEEGFVLTIAARRQLIVNAFIEVQGELHVEGTLRVL